MQVVRQNLQLDLKHSLAYANAHRPSMQAACQGSQEAPSGNRPREALAEALPNQPSLQRAVNWMFRQQLHPPIH